MDDHTCSGTPISATGVAYVLLSAATFALQGLFAAILLGERLEPAQLAGGLVLLVGVLVVIRERGPATSVNAPPLSQ